MSANYTLRFSYQIHLSNLGGIKYCEDIGEDMVGTDVKKTKHPSHSQNTVEGETSFDPQPVTIER